MIFQKNGESKILALGNIIGDVENGVEANGYLETR